MCVVCMFMYFGLSEHVHAFNRRRLWWDNKTSFADSNYWPAGNSWRQDYRQLSDWQGVCTTKSGTQQCK
jgi:hypothetical protein